MLEIQAALLKLPLEEREIFAEWFDRCRDKFLPAKISSAHPNMVDSNSTAKYAERERVISKIQHDLFAPLLGIHNEIEDCGKQLRNGLLPNEYFVPDLQVYIETARNLVAALDRDPTKLREYFPQRTMIQEEIIAGMRNMLSHYARFENEMRIEFDVLHIIPPLFLDRTLIRRAISNLVFNAVKYGTNRTSVHVGARKDALGYYLDVTNHGEGIASEEAQQIFKIGWRSPKAIKKHSGLGLGLPIARSIMVRHSGELILTSTRNPIVFSLFFPGSLTSEPN